MENRKQRLIDLLRKKSLIRAKEGESFTLSSGKTSDYYLDVRKTALSAEGHHLLGNMLWETIATKIKPLPEAVAGPALGACPLISAVSYTSFLHKGGGIPALYIRKEYKEYGTKNLIEGEFEKGMKIVLVEDVVTSASSLIRSYNAVTVAGGIVVGAIVVVDREEGAVQAVQKLNIPFFSLCKISDIL